jgi:CheY-like chemotaxis protein
MARIDDSPAPTPPPGLRILLVEDDALVGHSIVSVLEDLGLEVIGPVPAMAIGAMLADSEHLDAAILDIRLTDGDTSFPVAATLAQRGIPFCFVTGYDAGALPLAFVDRPVIGKPVEPPVLLALLERLIGSLGASSGGTTAVAPGLSRP